MKELRKLAELAAIRDGSAWRSLWHEDSAYIAAASPDVVLRLLDVVEKAQAMWQWAADNETVLFARGGWPPIEGWWKVAQEFRTALSSLEKDQ